MRHMNSIFIVILTGALSVVASAIAAVPPQIAVQGKATDAAGVSLPAGAKTFTFRIFNVSAAGTQVWPAVGGEVQSITTSTEGLWVSLVGAVSPLTDSVFADSVRWLEINVDGTTLPRVRLVTGPYAFRVATVDGASGGTIKSKLSIGPGHTNTGANAFVAGESNSATSDWATIGGGQQNSASGFASTISGGRESSPW